MSEKYDHDILLAYLKRYWDKSPHVLPTVREAARSLGWTIKKTMQAADDAQGWGLEVDVVGYNHEGAREGDLLLEWYGHGNELRRSDRAGEERR